MLNIAFLNGQFLPLDRANVSILDRGLLFADGVYEVTAVANGRMIQHEDHFDRLYKSLESIELAAPLSWEQVQEVQLELVQQNQLVEGIIYLQITRGAAIRDFAFPAQVKPTVFAYCSEMKIVNHEKVQTGVKVITLPDQRWLRRDIKSVSMLPQVLAKQKARSEGAFEAWQVEDGHITEGSSTSAFIVRDGTLFTHPQNQRILAGTVRKNILKLWRDDLKLEIRETAFTPNEAKEADEAFLTSASTFVLAVVEIDGHPIGNGRPGELATRLRHLYLERNVPVSRF
jgi:D-alanine transaminase